MKGFSPSSSRPAGKRGPAAFFFMPAVCLAALALAARAQTPEPRWKPGLRAGAWYNFNPNVGTGFGQAKAYNGGLDAVYLDPHAATNNVKDGTIWKRHMAWVYRGQILLPARCWFAEDFDDGVYLRIDGDVLIDDLGYESFSCGEFRGSAGWHEFELRLYNADGFVGPNQTGADGFRCGFGICTNAAAPASMADCFYPADPGDMSVFRHDDDAATGFWREGLLISLSPPGLPAPCSPPAGWTTTNLTAGDTVFCTATNQLFLIDTHYACNGYTVKTNNGIPHAWALREAGDAAALTYTHGENAGRVTWLYEVDGYLLKTGVSPPGAGTVTNSIPPDLSDGCYRTGTSVTLFPAPATAAFRFSRWEEGGAVSADPAYSVTMDRPRSALAVFDCLELYWNGGEGPGGVWTNGASGWLDEAGNPSPWADGATAVFTNGAPVTAFIGEGGVAATAVRFEGRGDVTLTNGALTMIGAAKISSTGAAGVTINAPVAGTNGLTLSYGKPPPSPPPPFTDFLTTGDRLIFPGIALADIARADARMDGGWIKGGPIDATPCHVVTTNEDGSVSVQFQAVNTQTKCVKVSFRDGPGGVYAKAVWAKYMDAGTPIGTDFESGGNGGTVATSHGGNGYGICNLTASLLPPGGVSGGFVIGKPATFTGGLTIERGRLEFGPEGKLGTNGVFAGAVALGRDAVLAAPPCAQVFGGEISGAGEVLVRNPAGGAVAEASFTGGANWTGGLTVGTNGVVTVGAGPGIPSGGAVALAGGGALDIRDGAAAEGGALGLSGPGGRLILGGGTVEFAASGSAGWEGGASLLLEGAFKEKTVRFGTDASGLTAAQLLMIRLEGDPETMFGLTADGWLCIRHPPGTVITILR